jgi:hypothetical protein
MPATAPKSTSHAVKTTIRARRPSSVRTANVTSGTPTTMRAMRIAFCFGRNPTAPPSRFRHGGDVPDRRTFEAERALREPPTARLSVSNLRPRFSPDRRAESQDASYLNERRRAGSHQPPDGGCEDDQKKERGQEQQQRPQLHVTDIAQILHSCRSARGALDTECEDGARHGRIDRTESHTVWSRLARRPSPAVLLRTVRAPSSRSVPMPRLTGSCSRTSPERRPRWGRTGCRRNAGALPALLSLTSRRGRRGRSSSR